MLLPYPKRIDLAAYGDVGQRTDLLFEIERAPQAAREAMAAASFIGRSWLTRRMQRVKRLATTIRSETMPPIEPPVWSLSAAHDVHSEAHEVDARASSFGRV